MEKKSNTGLKKISDFYMNLITSEQNNPAKFTNAFFKNDKEYFASKQFLTIWIS